MNRRYRRLTRQSSPPDYCCSGFRSLPNLPTLALFHTCGASFGSPFLLVSLPFVFQVLPTLRTRAWVGSTNVFTTVHLDPWYESNRLALFQFSAESSVSFGLLGCLGARFGTRRYPDHAHQNQLLLLIQPLPFRPFWQAMRNQNHCWQLSEHARLLFCKVRQDAFLALSAILVLVVSAYKSGAALMF